MTRLDALRALEQKVAAGEWDVWCEFNFEPHPYWARYAFHGSLDAAKALHEAVLPGWTVRLCAYTTHGNSPPHVHVFRMRQTEDDPVRSGNSSGYEGDNPARAWLLAIIRALIAEGEG